MSKLALKLYQEMGRDDTVARVQRNLDELDTHDFEIPNPGIETVT